MILTSPLVEVMDVFKSADFIALWEPESAQNPAREVKVYRDRTFSRGCTPKVVWTIFVGLMSSDNPDPIIGVVAR